MSDDRKPLKYREKQSTKPYVETQAEPLTHEQLDGNFDYLDDKIIEEKYNIQADIGSLSALQTTAKNTLVDAINEATTSVGTFDVTTDDISEGTTNLYYTDARALAATDGQKVLFKNKYDNISDLPSATDYHGMFAHVHAEGKAYFAHAGNWIELTSQIDYDTLEQQVLGIIGQIGSDELSTTAKTIIGAINEINGVVALPPEPYVYSILPTSLSQIAGAENTNITIDASTSPGKAPPGAKFRLVIKYNLSTGINTTVLDELRLFNFASQNEYTLSIPRYRDYLGAKIDSVTIEVYDDPDGPSPRSGIQQSKTVPAIDAISSITVSQTTQQYDEGDIPLLTVNTVNVPDGSTFNYEIQFDTADAADIMAGMPTTGNLTVFANPGDGLGSVLLDLPLEADTLTEGDETLSVVFTGVEYPTLTETVNVIINDSSRATETWTFLDWINTVHTASGNTISDPEALIQIEEDFRTNVLGLTTPSDLGKTSEEVFLLFLRRSWIDDETEVDIETADTDYLNTLNGYVTTYNTGKTNLGAVNSPQENLIKRPDPDSIDPEDDIAWQFVSNNTQTPITSQTVIYTGTELNPNDL